MERNVDYVEKLCHCVPYVFNKLRDIKYLMFSFDSPSYIVISVFQRCFELNGCSALKMGSDIRNFLIGPNQPFKAQQSLYVPPV